MQVEIAKSFVLFGETTTILFIWIWFYFSFDLHLKLIFYFILYKYIVWLEMSTIKYVSGYEKIKKRRKISWVSKHDVYYDIDGLDLFLELKALKEFYK